MKRLYFLTLIILLGITLNTQAQAKKYNLPRIVAEQMLENIPARDGKIFFEERIAAGSSVKKDELCARLEKWFIESFAADKSSLDTYDKENGVIVATCAFKYKNISGLIANTGFVTCNLKATAKDGELSYEVSDLRANESTNGITGLASTGIKHGYELNEILDQHRSGKKTNFTSRQLNNMNQLIYYIKMSFKDLLK